MGDSNNGSGSGSRSRSGASPTQAKYRIAAVAEMTGVPSATLRAWERRYGIPAPRRTSSAYRLYDESDIEAIRELVGLREEGMSAADAARVVRERVKAREAAQARTINESENPFEGLRRELLAAVRSFDYTALEQALSKVMFVGNVSTIFERVIAPAMVEVGDLWHAGEISVGQEHMATQLLEGAARDMLRMLEVSERARNVVLACFATEEHSLPVYGVAYRMVRWGFRPVMLGPRTPPSAIAAAVRSLDPALIGLSLTIPAPPADVREFVEHYVAAARGVPVVIGGRGAEEMRELIEESGAIVPGSGDLEAFRETVESVVGARNVR